MKISLIQPGRNNLKYLKWSYDSIRKNQGEHEVEICVADDFSDDGTWDWCQEMMQKDSNFKCMRNGGPTRLGHTILYDRLVNNVATNDLCMIYHADMYLCEGALDAIEDQMYMKNVVTGDATYKNHPVAKTIVSLTRIEPPLHPPGPEKIIQDFGIEPEEFREEDFIEWYVSEYEYENVDKTTKGIFAPWAFWKKDFQEINGHDPLYAPQSKEDSDIFNRFQLNGVKFIQTWKGCVYHMTCRGSRFADGAKRNPDGQVFMKNRETNEWLTQNQRSTRNFIRKWGHMVRHDEYLNPIIPPKYDIGIRIKNCSEHLLKELEPWCSRIYSDAEWMKYITIEQTNTKFDLRKRCHSLTGTDKNDYDNILVEIDAKTFTQQDFQYIQQLPEIIANDILLEEDMGEIFQVGNLIITINNLETFEKELIVCKKY